MRNCTNEILKEFLFITERFDDILRIMPDHNGPAFVFFLYLPFFSIEKTADLDYI